MKLPAPATWTEHVLAQLPLWERELRSHVSLVADQVEVCESLYSTSQLLMASDGAATSRKGSHGALLATNNTILVECCGHAQDADPNSFGSEGHGMLGIICTVFHQRKLHFTRNRNLRLCLCCDSESMIKHLEASREPR
jgi:hypothetical protein